MKLLEGMGLNIGNAAILMGVSTYILSKAKGIIISLWDMIIKRITSTYSFLDEPYRSYDIHIKEFLFNEYIPSINKAVFKNNIKPGRADYDKFELIYEIAEGSYLVYIGKLTWMRYSFRKVEKQQSADRILFEYSISFYGLGYKKELNKLITSVNRIIKDNEINRRFICVRSSLNGDVRSVDIDNGESKEFDSLFFYDKDKLVNTLDTWKESKEFYNSKGINYKLGIMLEGEPGTGKSSTAIAIAKYLKYNLTILSESDITSIKKGNFAMHNNCVYLLEDIDCMGVNVKSRDAENNTNITIEALDNKSSFNDLLQILDGVQSPSNCIFIITTNHIDKLDPAIFRPGRIDLNIHMGKVYQDIASEMFDFFGISKARQKEIFKTIQFPIEPCKLQNIAMSELDILNIKGINSKYDKKENLA